MVKKIEITPIAKEKMQELVNGSKEAVLDFFNNIDKYLKSEDYTLLFKGDKVDFFYKKCKNVYLVFNTRDKEDIGIVDILTETEFNKIKENSK